MAGRVGGILLCAVVLNCTWHASAAFGGDDWILGLQGKTRWTYGQYTQMGRNGFFGTYDTDRSTVTAQGGDFASLNGWMGVQNASAPSAAPNFLVSGSNSSATTMDFELNPKASLGWANIGGRYRINAYDALTAQGSEVPMSPGNWTNWSAGLTMPIGGAIFVGKSLFQRGFGLQFSWNRTQEYILFDSNPLPTPNLLFNWLPSLRKWPIIGPVRAPVQQICRKQKRCPPDEATKVEHDCDGNPFIPFVSETDLEECLAEEGCLGVTPCSDCPPGTLPVKDYDPDSGKTAPILRPVAQPVYKENCTDTAYLKFGIGVIPWQTDPLIFSFPPATNPWNVYDVNVAPRVNLIGYLTWYNDELEISVGKLYSDSHAGPELAQSTLFRLSYVPTDRYVNEGWLYWQYNNGRLLLRSELDWYYAETRYQSSANGTFFGVPVAPARTGLGFAPDFVESLRLMVDAKIQLGPTLLGLFYSHMPGPDRRHGILIKKQPFIRQQNQVGLDPFYPVSSLIAYRYGAGANSFGDLVDASVIAARVDHSLAANLNVHASFLHATRVSHGYGWGYIRPQPTLPVGFGQVQYLDPPTFFIVTGRDPFFENIPAIPDRDLGWEVGVGLNWQLLDQLIVDFLVSYWRPGKWFNYACIDKSVLGWNNPTVFNNWGISPNRHIDPVLGIELSLLTSF